MIKQRYIFSWLNITDRELAFDQANLVLKNPQIKLAIKRMKAKYPEKKVLQNKIKQYLKSKDMTKYSNSLVIEMLITNCEY